MRITNRMHLPEPLVKAVQSKEDRFFMPNEISVTQLLKPPRMIALERQYEGQISEDASERIWALMGDAIHQILGATKEENSLAEMRLERQIGRWKLTGRFDHFSMKDGVLSDWKVTSAWTYKGQKKGEKRDWEDQLNLYFYLLGYNGFKVNKLQIVAILRDWSKLEAFRDPEYPSYQVAILPIPVWSYARCQEFIESLLARHMAAEVELPKCTDRERWVKPSSWALVRDGAERATKVCWSEKEANDLLPTKKGHHIEYRPGESTRCQFYCAVKNFCKQWESDPTNPDLNTGEVVNT